MNDDRIAAAVLFSVAMTRAALAPRARVGKRRAKIRRSRIREASDATL
jgi:hypothetical protein